MLKVQTNYSELVNVLEEKTGTSNLTVEDVWITKQRTVCKSSSFRNGLYHVSSRAMPILTS